MCCAEASCIHPSMPCLLSLGVKSGTGVIDQVLSVQLSQLCVQLHMLVVSDAEAAEALVLLVNKLDEQHFQQLQVRCSRATLHTWIYSRASYLHMCSHIYKLPLCSGLAQ